MARNVVKAGFVLVIFTLIVAFLVPGLYSSPDANAVTTYELVEGYPESVEDKLEVNATGVNQTSTNYSANVTVVLTNTETFNSTQVTVNESETRTVLVEGENVTVTLESVRTAEKAYVTLERPALYGWASGPRGFVSNIGLIVLGVGALMILGLVRVASI